MILQLACLGCCRTTPRSCVPWGTKKWEVMPLCLLFFADTQPLCSSSPIHTQRSRSKIHQRKASMSSAPTSSSAQQQGDHNGGASSLQVALSSNLSHWCFFHHNIFTSQRKAAAAPPVKTTTTATTTNVLTFFPPDWGMLRRSRCIQIFL